MRYHPSSMRSAARSLWGPGILAISMAGLIQPSHSEPLASERYHIDQATIDSGGHLVAGGSYRQDSSIGGISGVSQAVSGATAKQGYVAQLHDAISMEIAAPSSQAAEGTTVQLDATLHFDDGTTTRFAGAAVTWSILSGAIETIDANGSAKTGRVYQDSPASLRGSTAGLSADLQLTVLNVTDDDFGLYADDGIDDTWQVGYFGADNPDAAADRDPSGTGQNNLFKFTALDPASRFVLATGHEGITGQITLTFSPCFPGRTYTVMTSDNLSSWAPLSQQAAGDAATERVVVDSSAMMPAKFYRVDIIKP